MHDATDPPHDPRRSRWVPWAFVAFFVVVLGANGAMVYAAFSSWTGLTDEHGSTYRQGLEYNQRLEEVAEQQALGWTVDSGFERGAPRTGELWITLQDAYANTLPRAEVTADLVRPTTVGYDFQVPLEDVGDGRYAATIAFPLSGQWEVDITALHPQGSYRLTERIYVR